MLLCPATHGSLAAHKAHRAHHRAHRAHHTKSLRLNATGAKVLEVDAEDEKEVTGKDIEDEKEDEKEDETDDEKDEKEEKDDEKADEKEDEKAKKEDEKAEKEDKDEEKADEKEDEKEDEKDEKEDKDEEEADENEDKKDAKEDKDDEKAEAKEDLKAKAEAKAEAAKEKIKLEKMVLEDRLESVQAEILNLKKTQKSIEKDTYTDHINNEAAEVSAETETSHLGPMLGSMRKDMWTFAGPFFVDNAAKELAMLAKEEKDIKKQLADLEESETLAKEEEPVVAVEKEEKEPAAKPVKKRAEAPAGSPKPMFTEKTMPPVSPTLLCVINLSLQYFVIYTLLAVFRTANQFSGGAFFGLQKVMEIACSTVTYAPMLSVLFVGTRMRAIQLTQGDTEKYKLPQPWVQSAMFICSYAVVCQVILVLIMPVFTGGMNNVTVDSEGNIDTSKMKVAGMAGKIITAIRYVIMAMLYGGFTVVCYGAYTMEAPKEIWGDKPPPVAPALQCTISLTCQFFAVYLALALVRTAVELSGPSPFLTKLGGLLTMAKYTVNFAPMLSILFIGARMRALQIDPKHGSPQKWAQNCFYLCTYSVLLQTLLVIILPFATECTVEQGASEGDVVFLLANKTIGIVMTVVRYVALLALYGGFTAVMVSVFVIEHPAGPEKTPPISPAMQCVMNLTVQYFTIYLALFVCITINQFFMVKVMELLIAIFEAGQKTVMFAPMLSILFIGARMRALQLTKATDGTIPTTAGPQKWAQDGMFLSTWSVLVQVIMCMIVPILTGSGKPETDDDGNVKTPQGSNKWVAMAIDIIRYLCLIAMYGGAVTVMYAIFVMTPETLPPYADDKTLIPGVDVPKPPSPDTPGSKKFL